MAPKTRHKTGEALPGGRSLFLTRLFEASLGALQQLPQPGGDKDLCVKRCTHGHHCTAELHGVKPCTSPAGQV